MTGAKCLVATLQDSSRILGYTRFLEPAGSQDLTPVGNGVKRQDHLSITQNGNIRVVRGNNDLAFCTHARQEPNDIIEDEAVVKIILWLVDYKRSRVAYQCEREHGHGSLARRNSLDRCPAFSTRCCQVNLNDYPVPCCRLLDFVALAHSNLC